MSEQRDVRNDSGPVGFPDQEKERNRYTYRRRTLGLFLTLGPSLFWAMLFFTAPLNDVILPCLFPRRFLLPYSFLIHCLRRFRQIHLRLRQSFPPLSRRLSQQQPSCLFAGRAAGAAGPDPYHKNHNTDCGNADGGYLFDPAYPFSFPAFPRASCLCHFSVFFFMLFPSPYLFAVHDIFGLYYPIL